MGSVYGKPVLYHYCDFCGKRGDEVKQLIAGPAQMICCDCIWLCCEILEEKGFSRPPTNDPEG